MGVLDEVQEILAEVRAVHVNDVSTTHRADCWKYHAGCLAEVLSGVLDTRTAREGE